MSKSTITISLISHTNVGKTTLARTLLRRDIGEVRDQPHVTTVSEAHVLIETAFARLLLWDTPGFGDSVRLLARLRREREPVGWLLHQVWDRIADRSLWCSQEAVRNVREHADVVVYLVNAAEDPEAAGYLAPEMELLAWLDKPVVVVLNQIRTDSGRDDGPASAPAVSSWRSHLARFRIVRDVLPLDAFGRVWMQESLLFDRVAQLLEGNDRDTMAALARAWDERNAGVLVQSIDAMAAYLAEIAADREPLHAYAGGGILGGVLLPRIVRDLRDASRLDRKRAIGVLFDRAQVATGRLMDRLIAAHELSGASKACIERRIADVALPRNEAINPTTGALAGSVISGALTGVGADLLSGGLSFGAGAVVGGLAGLVGGYTLGSAYRLAISGREPAVGWQLAALDRFVVETLLRYLAVAHFGRGRGAYSDVTHSAYWEAGVKDVLGGRRRALHAAWRGAATGGDGRSAAESRLRDVLGQALREVLARHYPDARVPPPLSGP